MQHINLVEKGIQTFKVKFKSVLCRVGEMFPLHLWDRPIPQTDTQVNLLRQTNVMPKNLHMHNSTYHTILIACRWHHWGVPPKSTKNNNSRESWAPNSINGWYLGITNAQYFCYNKQSKETISKRVSDTFYPKKNTSNIQQ